MDLAAEPARHGAQLCHGDGAPLGTDCGIDGWRLGLQTENLLQLSEMATSPVKKEHPTTLAELAQTSDQCRPRNSASSSGRRDRLVNGIISFTFDHAILGMLE